MWRLPVETAAAPTASAVRGPPTPPRAGPEAQRQRRLRTTVTRPKGPETKTAEAGKPGMTEAFFEALTAASTYGVQYAQRVLVACP